MPPVFGPKANALSRLTLLVIFSLVMLALYGGDQLQRSPYITEVNLVPSQPVPFTHQHHVGGLGIDCRYCHTSVEESSFAGIPPTSTCLNCHSQVWADAPMLAPLRESARTGNPIAWTRVHDLPDFVHFDHSIHVKRGIGCTSCHGQVDEMPLTWKTQTLYMGWCLNCHRQPEKFIRQNAADVFDMEWTPDPKVRVGADWLKSHRIDKNIHCSTCHQ